MPPSHGPARTWAEYLGARTAASVLAGFDPDAAVAAAAALGRVLHALDRRRRARVDYNLRLAFPHWDAARRRRVARGAYEHLLQLAAEVCLTPRAITPGSWAGRTRIAGLGPAIRRLSGDRPAILLTGHLGNWEVLGYLLAVLGYDVDAIARPLNNPRVNDWLLGIRQKRGMRIITKWDATDRMVGVLSRGGALAFIADQNAGDKGLFVPFFGRLASTYKSIALLAMHQSCPVICGYAHRVGPGSRFELGVADIIEPGDWADRRDPLYYITARYVRAIETMVRRRPEQYLWLHRRWKSRPRHERLGKPLPAALRRNLEELPWMDAEQLDRLSHPPPPPGPPRRRG